MSIPCQTSPKSFLNNFSSISSTLERFRLTLYDFNVATTHLNELPPHMMMQIRAIEISDPESIQKKIFSCFSFTKVLLNFSLILHFEGKSLNAFLRPRGKMLSCFSITLIAFLVDIYEKHLKSRKINSPHFYCKDSLQSSQKGRETIIDPASAQTRGVKKIKLMMMEEAREEKSRQQFNSSLCG